MTTEESGTEIGTGSNQDPLGSILRIIPGRKGNELRRHHGDPIEVLKWRAVGGSAVVVLPAGKTNWDSESIVAMVAGGGGGGGSTLSRAPG